MFREVNVRQLVQIGRSAPSPNIREMFELIAQREADEIRRLKEAASRQFRTDS